MSAQTVVDIGRKLDVARRQYSVMSLSAPMADIEAVEKIIEQIRKQVDRFSDAVAPAPGKRYPALAEKIAVLTIALEKIANRTGAMIVPPDTLLAHVVDACPTPDAAQFWAKEWPQALFGLISHELKLAAELRTLGVLVWAEHADRLTRLVNTSWLTAHGDIFRFVTGDRAGGNRCRFCRLAEPHNSILLTEVATPSSDWKRARLTIPQSVQAHKQCAPFWLEWVALARQYESADEADGADVAAGRTPSPAPMLPAAIDEPAMTVEGCTGE